MICCSTTRRPIDIAKLIILQRLLLRWHELMLLCFLMVLMITVSRSSCDIT